MGGTDDEGERDDGGEEQVSLTTSSDGYGRRVGGVGLLTPAAVCIVAKREVLDLWGGCASVGGAVCFTVRFVWVVHASRIKSV